MIASTINPGATTAAVRLIVFGNACPITPPPAATSTRKNVPRQLREQPPPLPRRILKVREHPHETLRLMLRESHHLTGLAGRPTLNRPATHPTPLDPDRTLRPPTVSRSRPPRRTHNSPVRSAQHIAARNAGTDWSNPVGLDVAVDEDWVSIERGPGRSGTGPGAGPVVEARWPTPGGHHLGDGGDEKELTDNRLEDGERLTGVALRH